MRRRVDSVRVLTRRPSPGGRPQPLAFRRDVLWIGSLETAHLYALDTKTWSIVDTVAAPGKPYGLASFGEALRVVISLGEDDDRYLYRFVPGVGFDSESKTACPELTGSHLASDGKVLYLLQMGFQQIVVLGADGSAQRRIALPTRCAGLGFSGDVTYIIAADEEFDELNLATLDLERERPVVEALASLPAEARGLVSDGTAWWTSLRDDSEIVSFALPD